MTTAPKSRRSAPHGAARPADAAPPAASQPAESPAAAAKSAPRRSSVRRSKLGPVGRLEDFIPFKLAVVANRISQSIGHIFETRFNIQMPEWRVLMTLYAYGELPFHELVARTSMDKARVSRAQRRLVDLRMIVTEVDAKDGRKLRLSITEAGSRICTQILPAAAAREAWFLEALTEEEHQQFDIILDKLMVRSLGSE